MATLWRLQSTDFHQHHQARTKYTLNFNNKSPPIFSTFVHQITHSYLPLYPPHNEIVSNHQSNCLVSVIIPAPEMENTRHTRGSERESLIPVYFDRLDSLSSADNGGGGLHYDAGIHGRNALLRLRECQKRIWVVASR